MELKDVILSTLAEMEDNESTKNTLGASAHFNVEEKKSNEQKSRLGKKKVEKSKKENSSKEIQTSGLEDEVTYLNSIRERLLVLFEGFQAPNNVKIEAKIDLTLNFLEYVLATIDSRIEKLEKGSLIESI